MNKSLEPNLHNLLPSLAGPIPSELLDLATSLLAQSHTRISNLKANEEIARSYVCAHLACERLKNKIDIPSIEPNPPLPPKEYNKLLAYFKTSLAPAARASTRTRNAPVPAPTPAAAPPPPPVTATAPASTSAPARASDALDPTLAANLKALCTRLNAPNAYTYVYNGVHAVLTAAENRTVRGKAIEAISVAVGILVIERLSAHDTEIPIGNIKWKRGTGYKTKQREVMAVLAEVARTKAPLKHAVDDWVQKLSQQGFRKWPWMQAVPDGVGAGGNGVLGRVGEVGESVEAVEVKGTNIRKRKAEVQPPQPEAKTRKVKAESSATGAKVPAAPAAKKKAATKKAAAVPKTIKAVPKSRPKPKPKTSSTKTASSGDAGGGGTMLQDRVDYLTEKKKNSFQIWKLQILEKCAEVEAL